jgi:hypothetical protein
MAGADLMVVATMSQRRGRPYPKARGSLFACGGTLAQVLRGQGLTIARRTVAKYREGSSAFSRRTSGGSSPRSADGGIALTG